MEIIAQQHVQLIRDEGSEDFYQALSFFQTNKVINQHLLVFHAMPSEIKVE